MHLGVEVTPPPHHHCHPPCVHHILQACTPLQTVPFHQFSWRGGGGLVDGFLGVLFGWWFLWCLVGFLGVLVGFS